MNRIMRGRYLLSSAVMLATLLIVVFFLAFPESAVRSASTPSQHTMDKVSSSSLSDYLIVLAVTLPDPAEIPPGLTPEQAVRYVQGLTSRQAQPLLVVLERLRAEGRLTGFEVQPDRHGVAITGATAQALQEISRLRGIAAVIPHDGKPPVCVAAAAKALPEQLLGLSTLAARGTMAALSSSRTDPSIDVYTPQGDPWSSVAGHTTPNTRVSLSVLRGGRVIATQSTTSNGKGDYVFSPSWQLCPGHDYNWSLRPHDVVSVTAHGNSVSTVVAYLRAWVDPGTNIVAGQTNAGRRVEIRVDQPGRDPCHSTSHSKSVTSDGHGDFKANLSSVVDFDGRAGSWVYVRDARGNSTYALFFAYHISARFNANNFSGYIKPDVPFTATLSRGGHIMSTYNGQSNTAGRFSGVFTATIQPGDTLRINSGDVNTRYTAVGLGVTWNSAADKVTGTTSSGRLVQAYFHKYSWWPVSTTCSWKSNCTSTTSNSSGHFTMNAGMNLVRGDDGIFYVFDRGGNYQYAQLHIPAIVADMAWSNIYGYWGNPSVGDVTVTLKSRSGTIKWRGPRSVDSWEGSFHAFPNRDIVAHDIIEVTDGAVTETMTVQNLTARLDGGTGHLTGNAYHGHLVARLSDFRRNSDSQSEYCAETDVTGSSYDFTFAGAQVGGQDSVKIWNSGPNGHYTYRNDVRAFTVNVKKGRDYVNGYTETPHTPVTVTLRRNGSPVAEYTATSSSRGYFHGHLSSGTPVTITQGAVVQVRTGDGNAVSLPIPELTTQADGAGKRIYGKSPAGEPVTAVARRFCNDDYTYYFALRVVSANGSGNYSAGFDGLWWHSWYYGCTPMDLSHRCTQPAVSYYNNKGHLVQFDGQKPSSVRADVYEVDNSSATAKPYRGIQSHTFHATTDTDWVAFTVPAGHVGHTTYRIETLNLGCGMDTVLRLYNSDGSTLLLQDDDGGIGQASRLDWKPSAAGTYYVNIRPSSRGSTAYCDAVYDLRIVPRRTQIFLPLAIRDR